MSESYNNYQYYSLGFLIIMMLERSPKPILILKAPTVGEACEGMRPNPQASSEIATRAFHWSLEEGFRVSGIYFPSDSIIEATRDSYL